MPEDKKPTPDEKLQRINEQPRDQQQEREEQEQQGYREGMDTEAAARARTPAQAPAAPRKPRDK